VRTFSMGPRWPSACGDPRRWCARRDGSPTPHTRPGSCSGRSGARPSCSMCRATRCRGSCCARPARWPWPHRSTSGPPRSSAARRRVPCSTTPSTPAVRRPSAPYSTMRRPSKRCSRETVPGGSRKGCSTACSSTSSTAPSTRWRRSQPIAHIRRGRERAAPCSVWPSDSNRTRISARGSDRHSVRSPTTHSSCRRSARSSTRQWYPRRSPRPRVVDRATSRGRGRPGRRTHP
jgi:hypothetical protein